MDVQLRPLATKGVPVNAENVRCAWCGRDDEPLHVNYACPRCYTPDPSPLWALPRPNDPHVVDGQQFTVIATVFINDVIGLLLLLNREPPDYYAVVEFHLLTGRHYSYTEFFPNIVPAVHETWLKGTPYE